jgi:hypothetical protein
MEIAMGIIVGSLLYQFGGPAITIIRHSRAPKFFSQPPSPHTQKLLQTVSNLLMYRDIQAFYK